jgi:hypothetical protein
MILKLCLTLAFGCLQQLAKLTGKRLAFVFE